MRPGDREQRRSGSHRFGSVGRRLVVLAAVVGFLGVAIAISYAVTRPALAALAVGEPGSASRLLLSVAGLQVAGFGTVAVLFLRTRDAGWRSYLRLGAVTDWVLFYGTAVGLALMVLTVVATGVVSLLDLELTESATGAADTPLHYAAVFLVSTFLAVPMEELFFRGILQRRLEDEFHPGIAIAVASALFVVIHTGVSLGSAGELFAAGLFFSFGVVLGVSYTLTGNLFVPLIGHLVFNGVQILVRAIEVAA